MEKITLINPGDILEWYQICWENGGYIMRCAVLSILDGIQENPLIFLSDSWIHCVFERKKGDLSVSIVKQNYEDDELSDNCIHRFDKIKTLDYLHSLHMKVIGNIEQFTIISIDN